MGQHNAFIAAGRIADMVKKATSHGVSLDREKLKKELGDVLWYIAAVASDNQLTLQEVAEANMAKLRARYPQGFVKGGGIRNEVPPRPVCILSVDSPSFPPETDEYRQCGCISCRKEYEARGGTESYSPVRSDTATLAEGVPGAQLAVEAVAPLSINLRTEPDPTKRTTHCVSFGCGCSETTYADGKRTRTLCANNECRRLTR